MNFNIAKRLSLSFSVAPLMTLSFVFFVSILICFAIGAIVQSAGYMTNELSIIVGMFVCVMMGGLVAIIFLVVKFGNTCRHELANYALNMKFNETAAQIVEQFIANTNSEFSKVSTNFSRDSFYLDLHDIEYAFAIEYLDENDEESVAWVYVEPEVCLSDLVSGSFDIDVTLKATSHKFVVISK